MLTVYCDESGTHADSLATVVAGYLGHVRQWKLFGKEWRALLDREGVKVLHRTDLENFRREFKEWNEERRVRFLQRAHEIIKVRTIRGFAYAVVNADFKKVMHPVVEQAIGGIYGWCVQDCMVAIAKWAQREHLSEPIDYILENGAEGIEGVTRMFHFVAKSDDYRRKCFLGSWTFASKQDVIQLQAPDVLAYEAYKIMVNNVAKTGRPWRRSAKDLIRRSDRSNYWDEPKLRRYMESEKTKDFLQKLESGQLS